MRCRSSNAGYCFVDFSSPAAAAKALNVNGTPMPNTSRPFKLNWATGGGLADRGYEYPQPARAVVTNPCANFFFSPRDTGVKNVAPSTPFSSVISAQKSTNTFLSRSSRAASRPASLRRS